MPPTTLDPNLLNLATRADSDETARGTRYVSGHPNISSLKPEANQIFLQNALKSHSSQWIEFSKNKYHIRRKPDTYPIHSELISHAEQGLPDRVAAFWDKRTVYVEPHHRGWGNFPSKIAHWLRQHGGLDERLFPIQAVVPIFNSCAFVIFDEAVLDADVRDDGTLLKAPEDWKSKLHHPTTRHHLPANDIAQS